LTNPHSWRSEFNLGVDMMDRHHREMVSLCDAVADRANTQGEVPQAVNLLAELVGYVRMHCEAEEELMRRFCYPGRMDHQDRHHEMGVLLKSWEVRARRQKQAINTAFLLRLSQWVESHILGSDRGFSRFLLDHVGADPTALPRRRKAIDVNESRCSVGKSTVAFQSTSCDRFAQTQTSRGRFNRFVAGVIDF
jgi:hemerythrin